MTTATAKHDAPACHYARLIAEIDPTIDANGVVCMMRLEHRTLNHLPRSVFVREVHIARQCEEAEPGFLASVRASYGR